MITQLISTVSVGAGGAAFVEFSSIPQTGTDIVILLNGRSSAGTIVATRMTFNGASTSYSGTRIQSAAGTVTGQTSVTTAIDCGALGSSTAAFNNGRILITNYAGANSPKTGNFETALPNSANSNYYLEAGQFNWASAAAITTVRLTPTSGNFAQYTTVSLYLVTKGSGGATIA